VEHLGGGPLLQPVLLQLHRQHSESGNTVPWL
jgi:hypothetical protein